MVILEKLFKAKLNQGKIKAYLKKKGNTTTSEIKFSEQQIKVSVVQRTITPTKNVYQYIDIIESFVKDAREQQSNLVAFPEFNFFDLFGLIPGFKSINDQINKKAQKQTTTKAQKNSKTDNYKLFYSVFSATAQPINDAIHLIMSSLAKKYNIYIYSGTYILKENNNLYNAGALYSNKGERIGVQQKIHLTEFEEQLGLAKTNHLKVHNLDIGNVAFPICMDATYFETFRIARDLGVDIVILPIANNEEYNLHKALRGVWPRVQESFVYGLKPSLNGWFMGMIFTGKAGIFAPIEITDKKDGIIAISEKADGNFLITNTIDLLKLREARESAEYYGDNNQNFEKIFYEKTYKGER